jgi:hypothetical protein
VEKNGISLNSLKDVRRFINAKYNFVVDAYKDAIYENGAIQLDTVDFTSIHNLADGIILCKLKDEHIANYADTVDMMSLIYTSALECINKHVGSTQSPLKALVHKNAILDEIIDRISKYIYEGPYEYNVSFIIPKFPAPSSSITISSGIALDRIAITGKIPLSAGLSCNLNAAFDASQEIYSPCIRIACKGYSGSNQNSPLIVRALSTLKHLLMLGHITGLLDIKYSPDLEFFEGRSNAGSYYVSGKFANNVQQRIPTIFHAAMSSIHPTERAKKIFLDLLSGFNDDTKEIAIIKNCIESRRESFERIKSSTEWLFESIFTESTTPSYVMLCLAIEAMIGGTERNKSDTLSSRLAYCIGKTFEERNEIIKQFSTFYSKRSKIVHGSETMLTSEDKDLAICMRSFLEHMINADLNASFVLQ